MNVILCVDNKMGTMFNNRRQSRDKLLCKKVASLLNGRTLYIKPYSRELFSRLSIGITESEDYLAIADSGDFCFVEGDDLFPLKDCIEKVYLFKWNRDYPHDRKLNTEFLDEFKITYTEDFAGNSHDNITLEVYERN